MNLDGILRIALPELTTLPLVILLPTNGRDSGDSKTWQIR